MQTRASFRHCRIMSRRPSATLTETADIYWTTSNLMPINETQLNGRIATQLDRMNVRWRALGETHGAFQGSQRQPDILVIPLGGRPVVIENEYLPARTLEAEAIARLGEKLDPLVVAATGNIDAVVALRSPLDLRRCRNLDQVDKKLSGGIELEYALFTGTRPSDFSRFPQRGYIPGNIRDLAAFVGYASTSEEAIQKAIGILENGIAAAATKLAQAAEISPSTKQAIANQLKQEYSEQTVRMAATIMVNALVLHLNLVGFHGLGGFESFMPDGKPIPTFVLREWRKILKINYWAVFSIASELLQNFNPQRYAVEALGIMVETANRVNAIGVTDSRDLAGTIFQRLIADRKFLATFYTRPESATLLAHLAIPNDGGWADAERVKQFHIADYACGTGTLIHAAYRRVNQLHLFSGGEPEDLHSHMMENSLTACDVLPSAVHLTASMLSSSHPNKQYGGTRTVVAQYGKTPDGGVSIGSLDLLGSNGEVKPLIPLHGGTAVTGTGEVRAQDSLEMPQFSQDLVIMNPPFTRSGSDWDGRRGQTYQTKQFHGLSIDRDTQSRMSKLASEYGKGTCAHGYAGIASWFVALADRMVKHDGTIALVLPMTALQGSSWSKVRELIARKYSDVIVMTIATAKQDDQSFSADTGMAEALVVGRQSSNGATGRGLFVSLKKRPHSEMEAMEIARAISRIASNGGVRNLEDGPYGGDVLEIGEEQIGEVINASLSSTGPWPAVGIEDYTAVQCGFQLATGSLWLPRMPQSEALGLPIVSTGDIATIGLAHKDIVGSGYRTAFDRLKPPSNFPTYPMLWNHDAEVEKCLVVKPDSEGRVKHGRGIRADEIWETRSHTHFNADFRFNSQPLQVAFTEDRTIGGSAWPNVQFERRELEVAHALWGNSTLGLLGFWWHASRQQTGRGRNTVTSIRTMPTLDVTKLSQDQLSIAEQIFEDMRDREFLPANEAYRDDSRKELDRRVLVDLLGLPEPILEPLDLLRLKWCSEPSVHGGKGTAPPAS